MTDRFFTCPRCGGQNSDCPLCKGKKVTEEQINFADIVDNKMSKILKKLKK